MEQYTVILYGINYKNNRGKPNSIGYAVGGRPDFLSEGDKVAGTCTSREEAQRRVEELERQYGLR